MGLSTPLADTELRGLGPRHPDLEEEQGQLVGQIGRV